MSHQSGWYSDLGSISAILLEEEDSVQLCDNAASQEDVLNVARRALWDLEVRRYLLTLVQITMVHALVFFS
jgi:hypothetical protein